MQATFSTGDGGKGKQSLYLLTLWFFCEFFFVMYISCMFLVHCSLGITCWEKINLLAVLYVMFSWVSVIFQCSVLLQVWYLIVSIPDLCLLP